MTLPSSRCCPLQGLYALNTVRAVYESLPPGVLHEIIVVDDGTEPPLSQSFLTPDVLEKFQVTILRHVPWLHGAFLECCFQLALPVLQCLTPVNPTCFGVVHRTSLPDFAHLAHCTQSSQSFILIFKCFFPVHFISLRVIEFMSPG